MYLNSLDLEMAVCRCLLYHWLATSPKCTPPLAQSQLVSSSPTTLTEPNRIWMSVMDGNWSWNNRLPTWHLHDILMTLQGGKKKVCHWHLSEISFTHCFSSIRFFDNSCWGFMGELKSIAECCIWDNADGTLGWTANILTHRLWNTPIHTITEREMLIQASQKVEPRHHNFHANKKIVWRKIFFSKMKIISLE